MKSFPERYNILERETSSVDVIKSITDLLIKIPRKTEIKILKSRKFVNGSHRYSYVKSIITK